MIGNYLLKNEKTTCYERQKLALSGIICYNQVSAAAYLQLLKYYKSSKDETSRAFDLYYEVKTITLKKGVSRNGI